MKWFIWEDPEDNSITLVNEDNNPPCWTNGVRNVSERAFVLHEIEAETDIEAATKMHELLGWKPYKPF